jgi:hypothetical protein
LGRGFEIFHRIKKIVNEPSLVGTAKTMPHENSSLAGNMMKTLKRIIWCVGFFVVGAFVGRFLYDFMISLLNTEIIYTSLPEIYLLKLKVAGLFGFMSAAIYFGTTAPNTFNRLQRFLVITIPSVTMCGMVFVGRNTLLFKLLRMRYFDNRPAILVGSLRMELVPLSGLLTAIVIIAILFKRSGRQQL